MSSINWKNKCWVATIFLVNNKNQVLLSWNKNLQTWIPVGGHIDEGETPEEAIKREVKEETGFEFTLHNESIEEDSIKVLKPHRFQIEHIPNHHGHHMNFVFLGSCHSYDSNVTETDENERLKWFSKEELESVDMLDNVKRTALEAIELINC